MWAAPNKKHCACSLGPHCCLKTREKNVWHPCKKKCFQMWNLRTQTLMVLKSWQRLEKKFPLVTNWISCSSPGERAIFPQVVVVPGWKRGETLWISPSGHEDTVAAWEEKVPGERCVATRCIKHSTLSSRHTATGLCTDGLEWVPQASAGAPYQAPCQGWGPFPTLKLEHFPHSVHSSSHLCPHLGLSQKCFPNDTDCQQV